MAELLPSDQHAWDTSSALDPLVSLEPGVNMPDISTTRVCLFCSTPLTRANASREDTVPKWLQAELGIAAAEVRPTLTAPTGEQLEQRIHPVDQLRTGGICRSCNNGWMSELEGYAKPVLCDLISNRRALTTLRKSERQLLSRWAVKTAYVLDAGGLEARVPLEHLRSLYTTATLPKNVYVFAKQQSRTQPWYYAVGGWWNHAQITEDAKATVANRSYKIALQFGDLILVVVHWPLTGWNLRVEKGELVKLAPDLAVVKEYVHPQPMESSSSDRACLRYTVTVSVVPTSRAVGRAPAR